MSVDLSEPAVAAHVSFEARGWAFVPRLLDPQTATRLAEAARGLLDPAAEPKRRHPFHGERRDERYQRTYVDRYDLVQTDAAFREVALSPRVGRIAADLLGVRQVRFFKDIILVKQGAPDTLPTPIHQDLPFWPIDRSSALTFWIALRPVTPQMGSLQFFDGSHRWGLLGSHLPPAPPLEQRCRRLVETQPTAPHAMEPGDATAHESMTLHLAAANHTAIDRWGWAVSYIDADAIYTGAAHPATDGLGLTPSRPFDHDRFPVVGG